MDITLPETIAEKYDKRKPHLRKLVEDTWCIIDGNCYEIKRGFWWNGMSMPRLLWSAFGSPFDGETIQQILWHDIFYGTQKFKQCKCDDILEEMNVECNKYWEENDIKCNISFTKRKAITVVLKTCGFVAYNNQTEHQIAGCAKHLYINGEQFKP